MKRLFALWPVEKAIYAACVLGLAALLLMVTGVVSGAAVPVVLSMSLAQGLGLGAGLLFALSIAAEAGVLRSKNKP